MFLLQLEFYPNKKSSFESDKTKTTFTLPKQVYISNRIREKARQQQSKKTSATFFSKEWNMKYTSPSANLLYYLGALAEHLNTSEGRESFCDGLQSLINQWYSGYGVSPYILDSSERKTIRERVGNLKIEVIYPSGSQISDGLEQPHQSGSRVSVKIRQDDKKLKELDETDNYGTTGNALLNHWGSYVISLHWHAPAMAAAHELLHAASGRSNTPLSWKYPLSSLVLIVWFPWLKDSVSAERIIEEGMTSLFSNTKEYCSNPEEISILGNAIRGSPSIQSRKKLMDQILRTYLNLNDSKEIRDTEKTILKYR